MGIGPGYELVPPVNIPMGAKNLLINTDGQIRYVAAGGHTTVTAGQIHLCQFINPQQLKPLPDGIYTETDASGPPCLTSPGNNGSGQVLVGFLEESNVDPLAEWIALIRAERDLQFNEQAVDITNQVRPSMLKIKR